MLVSNHFNARQAHYGPWLIRLHWLMLILLAAVYACIELRVLFERGSAIREGLKDWHYALGLLVFVLVCVRLAVRLAGRMPMIVPPLPRWQRGAAWLVHLALYALMLAMPVLGWLLLSAEGDRPSLLGWSLPALIGADEGRAEWLESTHEWIGIAGYWLVGVHTVAALFHHYVMRDNTLLRMLPRRRMSTGEL